MSSKKEYKLLWSSTGLRDLEDQLNKYGQEGWRVVTTLEGLVIILERDK